MAHQRCTWSQLLALVLLMQAPAGRDPGVPYQWGAFHGDPSPLLALVSVVKVKTHQGGNAEDAADKRGGDLILGGRQKFANPGGRFALEPNRGDGQFVRYD